MASQPQVIFNPSPAEQKAGTTATIRYGETFINALAEIIDLRPYEKIVQVCIKRDCIDIVLEPKQP